MPGACSTPELTSIPLHDTEDKALSTFIVSIPPANKKGIFNLLPIGALDGHYILPYLLPRRLAALYRYYNARYGNYALLAIVGLAILGVPIFSTVINWSSAILPFIVVI